MKPGNLVKITRGSIGVPKDSLALVLKEEGRFTGHLIDEQEWKMFSVKLIPGQGVHKNIDTRRYYARDLFLVSQ